MTACLCVENWNGKIFVSLYADKKTVPETVRQRQDAGLIRMLDIADEDVGHSLDLLRRLYLQQIDTKPKPEGQAKAEAQASTTSEQERVKMSKSELVRILDAIIRTSNQQGEIDAALAVYKKMTGQEWRC